LIWTALIVLGAVVALDATSFGQLMLSRPLVAGTLAGAVVGMPLEGAMIGALLEALSFSILPVGAAKYPETGTAAVAAVGALGLSGVAATPPALLIVLVYGLAWQRLFGATVIVGRYINERLVHAGEGALSGRMDRMIERRHVASMVLDLMRGGSVTAFALILGVPLLRLLVPGWTLPAQVAAVAVSAAAAAALAGAARLFGGSRREFYLLLTGAACGLLLLLLP
jgi:mannose/fructose/N-acetylgalactosamine-specific phosphotransferase system component IIC